MKVEKLMVNDVDNLEERIKELGPWHINVQLGDINTSIAKKEGQFVNIGDGFKSLMSPLIQDKKVLDCACNCGAYALWCVQNGAKYAYGFDIREHWINQANFLKSYFSEDKVYFEQLDLYNLLSKDQFDVTIFKGIFYHLPDPITGLKIAANLTREIIYIDTAILPNNECGLTLRRESDELMAGSYNLNWLPNGPNVIYNILEWLGFVEMKLHYINKSQKPRARMGIIASKVKGKLYGD